jgi:hypothetical protein
MKINSTVMPSTWLFISSLLLTNISLWGLGFYYAYRAYKQQNLLDSAMLATNMTMKSFITPADAAVGTGAGRNISFAAGSSCSTGMHVHI